jgi:ABC-type molybdate transport system substrate-binding protein
MIFIISKSPKRPTWFFSWRAINYYICRLQKFSHPQNAQKFLDFILSAMGQEIYKKYGFLPHNP